MLISETLRGSFKRCKDQRGQQSRNKKGANFVFSPRMPQTCPITLTLSVEEDAAVVSAEITTTQHLIQVPDAEFRKLSLI